MHKEGTGHACDPACRLPFQTSYDFFMIALDGDKDVERIVKEVKGMLPGTSN